MYKVKVCGHWPKERWTSYITRDKVNFKKKNKIFTNKERYYIIIESIQREDITTLKCMCS